MSAIKTTSIDPMNRSALQRFISLERNLLKKYPLYVSEIDSDVAKTLARKTIMSQKLEMKLFVVSNSGQDVGRCAAIINNRFQAEKQDGAGFIGYFAAEENCEDEVAIMMYEAEKWLRSKGVKKVIAPANGGAPGSMGIMISSFEEEPMFPMPWTPPYYPAYFDRLKYEPTYPLWFYEIDFANEKYKAAKERYANYDKAVIRSISKKNWNADIKLLTDLLNETFVNEWEFTSMSYDEILEFFGAMKMILAPRQILFAEVGGKPAGFCFAMPDLTTLFRSFHGKLGLGAIFKLLTRAKKYKRAGLFGIGITNEHKGKGLTKALALKLYEYHEELGLKSSLYYPVNEENILSRRFAESLGGKGQYRYQIYDKSIV